MTLLESLVAFIVLALVGIACLDLSRGAVELQRSSEEWTRAVTIGESTLAAATVDANVEQAFGPISASGESKTLTPRVLRRVWRDGVDVIEVTVPLPSGGEYQVSRLVARGRSSTRVAAGTTR